MLFPNYRYDFFSCALTNFIILVNIYMKRSEIRLDIFKFRNFQLILIFTFMKLYQEYYLTFLRINI